MLLSPDEAALFFKLHGALMYYVNQRCEIIPNVERIEEFLALSPEPRLELREALNQDMTLIESFVDENPYDLADDELDIVSSWREQVTGKFFIFRELKKHTVFLSTDEPSTAYGVVALTEPFCDVAGPYLPIWVETTLLPFKDKIVYDSLLNRYSISFGSGIKRSLNESYKEAKQRQGIVTSLPPEAAPVAKIAKKKRPRNPFVGRWRITWMEQWDQELVDEEVDGFFEFERDATGSFHFGLVQGEVDHRLTTRDGRPSIEFTWDGVDEVDPAMGRGWATIADGELSGTVYFHQGDESAFKASKVKKSAPTRRRRNSLAAK